ncbi:MAG: EboA domain-containing protein [Flavobacteriaceae bacterium]
MQHKNTGETLKELISKHATPETDQWIDEKLRKIVSEPSAKELYLSYSLLSGKADSSTPVEFGATDSEITSYLKKHNADLLQTCRIYLLVRALEDNAEYFIPKVANLIQLADTRELETFLKFLTLLPEAAEFKSVAVEALRTNIATVFDAISLNNPYPAEHFNDQQWNQMYLKAAFMQRNLSEIVDIDQRANKDLTRIISDYAHERWAASRDVDPYFWRPVTKFMDATLLEDMKRLLESENTTENNAAALCCFHSENGEAKSLLNNYPQLISKVETEAISWKNLKD